MSDPSAAPPPAPPRPPGLPPTPPPNRGLGWFLTISGVVVLLLTLGCVIAVGSGNSEDTAMGLVCGSPTFALGGLFLWLGTRRLKR
jgi:hypothetical protein